MSTTNPTRRGLQVIPDKCGWAVRREGQPSAARVYPTQAEAIRAAQDAARNLGGELFVHGEDGRIRASHTIGRRPFSKISEVEGITLSPEAQRRARELDERGLSSEERRQAIINAHQDSR